MNEEVGRVDGRNGVSELCSAKGTMIACDEVNTVAAVCIQWE